MRSFSLNASRTSLVYILIFTAVAAIDLTIVYYVSYSGIELPTSAYISLFVIFCLIFAISSIKLLKTVKETIAKSNGLPSRLRYYHVIIYASQSVMVAIMAGIILQMGYLNKYNLVFLQISTYLCHISASLFLIILISMFIRWLKSRKNYVMLLYVISFILILCNIIVSMIYLEYQYSFTNSAFRRPYPINSYVINQSITQLGESLATLYDLLSISSFSVIWLATFTLLKQYRYKIGKVKFFTLLIIPLIYYLFPFQSYFGNMFSDLVMASPVAFGMIYVLIFSATKQVGALLFSLAFWTASRLVVKDLVSKSLLISAIGMAMLFGSIDITALQYRLYPPFGLVTMAFMPLGSYMLLIGIFTSATGVSRDAKLRREFYKSVESRLSLLKVMGVTEMENQLLKEYKQRMNHYKSLEKYEYPQLEQKDVKYMIHDVISELQSRENATKKFNIK